MATVHGTNGADFIYDPISFGGNDTIYGHDGDDRIYGLGGYDTIIGGAGADYLDGGFGTDTASYSDSTEGVVVNLDTGQNFGGTAEGDTLVGIENVTGSSYADILVGDNGINEVFDLNWASDDVLEGMDGNDQLFGMDGMDFLDGGGDNDTLKGGGGRDWLQGGDGTDTLYGDSGRDWLQGENGTDTLHGGADRDYLEGGADNDTLNGGGGTDILLGGSGIDTADYGGSAAGVGISLFTNTAGGGDAEGDELDGIENLTGSAHADSLWGDDGINVLRGMHGNDTLKGFGGADTIYGGGDNDSLHGMDGADTLRGEAGNDVLDGGNGGDTMIGGLGNDTYIVDSRFDTVAESGGQGIDVVRTSVNWIITAGADIETLETTDANGTANLSLTGNSSGNVVRGNAGSNVINGGDGNDDLTGLGGQDSYLFNTALSEASNIDAITDFNVADDTIQLDDHIFSSSLTPGNSVAGSQFVIGAAATDANHRIIYNDATGAVLYDSDGTGATAAIQFAQLSAGLALTNFDFLVV